MVRFCLALWLMFNVVLVEAYDVKLSKSHMMMGDSLTVQFFVVDSFEDEQSPVEKLIQNWNWEAWQEHFFIEVESQGQRALRLKLYPYRSGLVELEEQSYANVTFKKTTLIVSENPDVSIEWGAMVEKTYWQQAWPIYFDVKTSKPGILVVPTQRQSAPWLQDKMLQRLEFNYEFHQINDVQWRSLYRLELPIGADPLSSLTLSLPMPVIEVRAGGDKTWRFMSPQKVFTIEALPSFLPAHTLIGPIHFKQSLLPKFLQTEELYYWSALIENPQMSASDLKLAVQQWLYDQPNIDSIEWFKADIKVDAQGARVQIPFRSMVSGKVDWPQWQFAFFNPESGKVQRQVIAPSAFWSFPGYLIQFAKIAFVVSILIVLWWIFWNLRVRFQAIVLGAKLTKSKDFLEVWQLLQAHYDCDSVACLRRAWCSQSDKAEYLIQMLNQALFSPNTLTPSEKKTLQRQLKQLIWQTATIEWTAPFMWWRLQFYRLKSYGRNS